MESGGVGRSAEDGRYALLWLPIPYLDELNVVPAASGPPRGVAGIFTISTTEWHSKSHDAPSGTPDPPPLVPVAYVGRIGLFP